MSEKSTPSTRFDGFTNDSELRQASHNVPAVRFTGFNDVWKVARGVELFEQFSDKGYPQLPVLSATQDEGMVLRSETDRQIIQNTNHFDSYKRVRPGQFVIHLRSFQGGFAFSKVEGITSPAYTVFGLKDTEQHPQFWAIKFASRKFIDYLKKVTIGIRDGRSIDVPAFMTLPETFPSVSEQKKIAALLSSVDETLYLCQRKLDLLTQAKKALMQQIFSRKLRFTADDGSAFPDWEEKKLGDLFVKAGSGGTPKSSISEYYGGDINFLSISDVSESNGHIVQTTKKLTESGLQHSTAWIVPKGSISLAMYASVGKVAILDIDAATSQAFYNMTFSDDDLRDLLYQKLTMVNDEGGWIPLISTGTQPNLNAEKVRNYVISLPSNRTEIHRINLVLHSADALVDQARAELEQWQEVKKSLLQQIFV